MFSLSILSLCDVLPSIWITFYLPWLSLGWLPLLLQIQPTHHFFLESLYWSSTSQLRVLWVSLLLALMSTVSSHLNMCHPVLSPPVYLFITPLPKWLLLFTAVGPVPRTGLPYIRWFSKYLLSESWLYHSLGKWPCIRSLWICFLNCKMGRW